MGKITEKLGYGKEGSATLRLAFALVESGEGIQLASFTVASLPAAADHTRRVVYVSNGNAGAACLAVSNGTSWLRIALGAAVAAS